MIRKVLFCMNRKLHDTHSTPSSHAPPDFNLYSYRKSTCNIPNSPCPARRSQISLTTRHQTPVSTIQHEKSYHYHLRRRSPPTISYGKPLGKSESTQRKLQWQDSDSVYRHSLLYPGLQPTSRSAHRSEWNPSMTPQDHHEDHLLKPPGSLETDHRLPLPMIGRQPSPEA
jgi:hypothetical protein